MSNADIVDGWFSEKIATGAMALDTVAYNQAFAAKADLIARLDAGAAATPPADPALIVSVWYPQQIACAAIARNVAADAQAEAAKSDLIGRLAAARAPTPAKANAKAAAGAATTEQPAADAASDPAA